MSSTGKIAARAAAFLAVTGAVWAACFAWRPPAPMLGLRHVERIADASQVALSFDDAPHPLTTPLLLASLKRAGAPATFFIIGDGARFYPELTRRIVRDGHALANHSQEHRNLSRLESGSLESEVEPCFAEIRAWGAGHPWGQTRLFRPPGGGLNRAAMSYLYRHGHTLAWWSLNTGDWTCPPAWKIMESVGAQLRGGDIVLLHDGGLGTPQALPAIVRDARRRGLRFVTMPE